MAIELPPMLAEFLRDKQYAMLATSSNKGAILIAKMPAADIRECSGRVPVHVDYQLFRTPYGPVVRLVLEIYSEPVHTKGGIDQSSFLMETFFNSDDPEQRADLADLIGREYLRVAFFDETLQHVISKRITHTQNDDLRALAVTAHRLLMETPPDQRDFDRAKQIIMDENPIF
jgi:hypothetical protein